MLKLKTLRFALLTATLAIVVNLALSVVTFAQHGRGRFHDKKDGKFINGHDARDGRWDGRGPRFRFGDRRDRGRRFRFRDRWDRDEWRDRRDRDDWFRFRNRRDRDDWRDRWRDDDRQDRWRDDDWRRRRMRRERRWF
jgi:hypothetical protein